MSIEKLRLLRYALPLTAPLRMRDGVEMAERRGLLLEIRDDTGALAYGDIAPLPGWSAETFEETETAAKALLERAAQGGGLEALPEVQGDAAAWQALPASLRCGLSMALQRHWAHEEGAALYQFLCPFPRRGVPLAPLITEDGAELEERLAALAAAGPAAVKIKVGHNVDAASCRVGGARAYPRAKEDPAAGTQDWRPSVASGAGSGDPRTAGRRRSTRQDAAATSWEGNEEEAARRVEACARALGPGCALRLDANRAWDFDTAVGFAEDVASHNIAYIEEPLAEPARLPEFHRLTGMPYALDETAAPVLSVYFDVDAGRLDASALEAHGWRQQDFGAVLEAAGAVIVKPTLVGEFGRLTLMSRALGGEGCRWIVSAAYESGVGIAALAQLAGALDEDDAPAGLDTYRYLAEDVLRTRLPMEELRPELAAIARLEGDVDDAGVEVIWEGH